MGLLKTESLQTTNFTGEATEYKVSALPLNSPTYEKETEYTPNFTKWNGYYKNIGEAKAMLNTLAKWVFGKGFKGEANKLTKIKGNGRESARQVLMNIWKVSKICGDGFGEIIKDKAGRLINIKPLNPEAVKVIYNKQGIIKEYRHTIQNKEITLNIDEVLHFSNGRIGDEMGGSSVFETLEKIIESKVEVLDDLRTLFHRFVKPIQIFESDTDDEMEIAKQVDKINKAYAKSENIVVPKGTIQRQKTEIVSTQVGNLSPLEYYRQLIRTFITSCGVPELIMGWSADTTEASSKITYLAWEQTIEDEQLTIEETIEAQLNIKINLEFPKTIEEQIQKDEKKDTPINKERPSELTPTKPKMNKI